MSEWRIAGCHECPLLNDNELSCMHREARTADYEVMQQRDADVHVAWVGVNAEGRDTLRAPGWCPLRLGALTLQLRTKGEPKVKR